MSPPPTLFTVKNPAIIFCSVSADCELLTPATQNLGNKTKVYVSGRMLELGSRAREV